MNLKHLAARARHRNNLHLVGVIYDSPDEVFERGGKHGLCLICVSSVGGLGRGFLGRGRGCLNDGCCGNLRYIRGCRIRNNLTRLVRNSNRRSGRRFLRFRTQHRLFRLVGAEHGFLFRVLHRGLCVFLPFENAPVAGQLEDGGNLLGRLCTDTEPLLSALRLDLNERGVLGGMVLADLLDHTTIALGARVSDNDAIVGCPDLAQTLKTNLDGHNSPEGVVKCELTAEGVGRTPGGSSMGFCLPDRGSGTAELEHSFLQITRDAPTARVRGDRQCPARSPLPVSVVLIFGIPAPPRDKIARCPSSSPTPLDQPSALSGKSQSLTEPRASWRVSVIRCSTRSMPHTRVGRIPSLPANCSRIPSNS